MIRAIAILVLFGSTFFVQPETVALAAAAPGCTRASLQATVEKYLDALQKGKPTLMPLAPQAKYMENRNYIPLGQGIWQKPLAVDFNRSLLDAETCQTFTEIVHTNSDYPYLIGTRLKIEDNKISEIESLVADKDDWLFNAADYLKYSSQEKWDILPPEKRSDRQTLLNAANAYYDTFGDYSNFEKVPWGTPCARIEGGMYTNRNNDPNASCTVGMPKTGGVKIINRHYLVDVDMGTVVGMVDFGADKQNPDFHEFRLENGKLRYVHTVQVCTIQPNCGLPLMKPKPPQ
jgi:hypothetical protein